MNHDLYNKGVNVLFGISYSYRNNRIFQHFFSVTPNIAFKQNVLSIYQYCGQI